MTGGITTQDQLIAFLRSDPVRSIKFTVANEHDENFPYKIEVSGAFFDRVVRKIGLQLSVIFVEASELKKHGLGAIFIPAYPRSVINIVPGSNIKTLISVLHESTHAGLYYLADTLTHDLHSSGKIFWALDEAIAFIAEFCLVVNEHWEVPRPGFEKGSIEDLSYRLAKMAQKNKDHLLNHGQVLELVRVIRRDPDYKKHYQGEPVPKHWN
jgi:hypothetical protein